MKINEKLSDELTSEYWSLHLDPMEPGKGWWQIDLHTWRKNKKVRKICHYKKDNILNWVSKVIRESFGFALFRYVIGPEKLFHFFYQSDSRTLLEHYFGFGYRNS